MHKFGDTRHDGFRFRGVQRVNGKTYDQWVSPEVWAARKAAQAAWVVADRAAHPDKHREIGRRNAMRQRQRDPIGQLLTRARGRAEKAGFAFTLTRADIVIPSTCPVLGIPLSLGTGAPCDGSPSLDRRNNSEGYTPANAVVVSHRANVLKRDATPDELSRLAAFYNSGETPC